MALNYAWAPSGYLSDQFGDQGRDAILDWSNEVTGWKDLQKKWEDGIAARDYGELAAFFTGTGYTDMKVGDKAFYEVKDELIISFSAEVKETPQYQSAYQLAQEIDQEYAAGQAIYGRLRDLKSKQVGNAVRAGAKVLIKDLIIDNIMIPAITPSASKASELIAGCISFVKDRWRLIRRSPGEPA